MTKLGRLASWLTVGLFLGGFAVYSQAQEILLHGPSYHFDKQFNNGTYGLGYEYKNFIGGGFYNSERNHSIYGGYRVPLVENLGVIVGVVTNYSRCDVCPAALLTYRVPVTKVFNLHISAAPTEGGFVNLSLGFKY